MSNSKPTKRLLLTAACVAAMAAFTSFAADGDKSTVKGLITAVQGDTVTVRDDNNHDHTITLTSTTEIKKKEGMAAVRFERMEKSSLIPGLPIVADVVEKSGNQEATAISFRADRLRTAQQVQAGVDPTAKQAAANTARMNDFGTYEAVATADVLFASGSTTISAQGKSDLTALAAKAKDLKDYRVVMQGFTDSTGDPAANQRLSTRRAEAVADFLREDAGLSPGRVQAGAGMGVSPDAGDGSNANARKVQVKLVVDKGVMDSSNK